MAQLTITCSNTSGGSVTIGALVGVDGITVISGSSFTTISGFRDEFVSASGSLQSQITNHATISDAHHPRYTVDENPAIIGGTNVTVVSGSNIITVSSTAGGGGGGGSVSNAMVGTDGITVLSGVPTASETTISGFRDEFVSASGSLQTSIDQFAVTSTSIDYSVLDTDKVILVDTSSQEVLVTLPTAVGRDGANFRIKKTVAGNDVVVTGTSSETIDTALAVTITTTLDSINVVSDDTQWWMI